MPVPIFGNVLQGPFFSAMVGENRRLVHYQPMDCPPMAGPNFQPLDGNPTVTSILQQLANGLENVSEM